MLNRDHRDVLVWKFIFKIINCNLNNQNLLLIKFRESQTIRMLALEKPPAQQSIKTNVARARCIEISGAPSRNVFNWNINFISMTSHYTTERATRTVELRSVVVARNLCKFAFKVIKLIQVFSFSSFSVLCLRLPTLQIL